MKDACELSSAIDFNRTGPGETGSDMIEPSQETQSDCYLPGVVVKLDRGFPLVHILSAASDGDNGASPDEGTVLKSKGRTTDLPTLIRCEHATALIKERTNRAAIGDRVLVRLNEGHDKGIIQAIEPRTTEFVRRDPADRTVKQVLAANFTLVIIAEPFLDLNLRRLERELVLAHETGAQVMVVLTKNDLIDPATGEEVLQKVRDLAGASVEVVALSAKDERSIDRLRSHISKGQIGILIGKSGVGKSTLVNLLVGKDVQETAEVRDADGKGRHTTVDRSLISLASGGAVVDMPGVRGLGIWDAEQGLNAAFADIYQLAGACRFRDCAHLNEPGCAVLKAIEEGSLAQSRLDSYRALTSELEQVTKERTRSDRMHGVKHKKKR